jgi:hypothetical protein
MPSHNMAMISATVLLYAFLLIVVFKRIVIVVVVYRHPHKKLLIEVTQIRHHQ